MGVHGLTTYLRENRRALSTTLELGASSPDPKQQIPIVVDGWSFIYNLAGSSGLPWVYGGEYVEFEKAVKTVVEAWIRVGLNVHFVFDGAYPDLKFSTLVTRLAQSHVQPSLLFFRTSPASRSTPRFLAETWMLPPLTYTTCVHALKEVQASTSALTLHFADEEGDPFAVELAGRLGGYVVGNDSDFVILNSEGYLGFIPIDEMVWQAPSFDKAAEVNQDDADFQVVRKPKNSRKATIPTGILPPEQGQIGLILCAYTPSKLANHLNLPITLLPLLGALVGNDFSSESESHRRRLQSLFFERNSSLTQRIEHAAKVVRSILTPTPMAGRKTKQEVGGVMDLIDRTVNTLLVRHLGTLGSGEVEGIVNGVVDATLQYAIPRADPSDPPLWPSNVCALHKPDTCPFLPIVSRRLLEQLQTMDEEDAGLLQVRELLIHAYRKGSLSPKILDPLNTASSWPRVFLEHPDIEAVTRSIGRPIREWMYSILDDAAGLPDPPMPVEQEPEESESDSEDMVEDEDSKDDDEIIDVVEEQTDDEDVDLLAPLKGELHRLHSSEDESSAYHPPSITSSQRRDRALRPPIIAEYIRRGTRIASEEVPVTTLKTLLESIDLEKFGDEDSPNLLLRPEEDRFTVLLRLLKSDTPFVRKLPAHCLAPVLALRWAARILSKRAQISGNKERDKERWTTTEARCWLASFSQDVNFPTEQTTIIPIVDRNIQLTAQILVALESIDQLAQVLLLEQRVPSTAHSFSGKRFHAFLAESNLLSGLDLDVVWGAVQEGMSGVFQEPKAKRAKKAKKTNEAIPIKLKTGPKAKGFFALLDSDL